MSNRLIAVLVALLALAAPSAAAAVVDRPYGAPAPRSAAAVPDRVIVVFEDGTRPAERLAARSGATVALRRTLGRVDVQLVEPRPGQSTAEAILELRSDPAVAAATRDGFYRPLAVPDAPLFDLLWGLRNAGGAFGVLGFPNPIAGADIDAIGAWARTTGAPGTVVAVIDSGYSFGHPDLADRHWVNAAEAAGAPGIDDDNNGYVDDVRGYDFVGADADVATLDADPTDDDLLDGGHGIHVAGTIGAAGDDGVGVVGVAPDVRLMPLRVCSYSADEEGVVCPHSSIIQAIRYAGANGARVANISLGGGEYSQELVDAIAEQPDVLFAVSAGNGGDDGIGDDVDPDGGTPTYPCAYDPLEDASDPLDGQGEPVAGEVVDNVVCVAATDQDDQLTGFSNFGARAVDIAAPGAAILSAFPVALRFEEDFEAATFPASWTDVGTDGGFGRVSESPLASWGITDSPGAAPVAGANRASETAVGVSLPTGAGACVVSGRRRVALGGGNFRYTVVRNGLDFAFFEPGDTGGPGMAAFSTQPIEGLGGGTVTLRFAYTAGANPGQTDGVWIDDLRVQCHEPVGSTEATYAYLSGTSMAAPHVSGAAALAVSLAPSLTVTEMRSLLLDTADPVAALDGLVATGGRVDAGRAMAAVASPTPPSPTPPSPSPMPPAPASIPTPAPLAPPAGPKAMCKVPKLAGKRLRRARRLLKRANCKAGMIVRQPRRARGRMVVKVTRPRAGVVRREGARVRIVLTTAKRYRAAKRRAMARKRRAAERRRAAR